MSEIVFELLDVCFSYSNKRVIKGISFVIKKSRFYALVGPNGSGKTTLLDLLMGIKTPESGRISFLGKDILSYSKKEIARKVALVPQLFRVAMPYTVEEVVAMGRYPHLGRFPVFSRDEMMLVKKAMVRVGIEHLKDRSITTLSGGERQLVMIARAIAQNTPVVFLDEPTSYLDVKHTLMILDLMKGEVETKGKTVLAVFHDLNLACRYADNLIFVRDGTLISAGSVKEVLKEKVLKMVFDVECSIVSVDKGFKYILFNLGNEDKRRTNHG